MRIGHVHLKVRDVDRATRFYREFLGMRERERVGRFVFLSAGAMHHEVALQEVGAHAGSPARQDVGLFHAAFEVPDKRTLASAYARLADAGRQVIAIDHRISWAIYFFDPDRNGLEIYCDTRGETGVEIWEGEALPLGEERLLAELGSEA